MIAKEQTTVIPAAADDWDQHWQGFGATHAIYSEVLEHLDGME